MQTHMNPYTAVVGSLHGPILKIVSACRVPLRRYGNTPYILSHRDFCLTCIHTSGNVALVLRCGLRFAYFVEKTAQFFWFFFIFLPRFLSGIRCSNDLYVFMSRFSRSLSRKTTEINFERFSRTFCSQSLPTIQNMYERLDRI